MLQFLRNNTKIIVWFAVFLMIGVFGLSSISLNKHDQYAGEVFGKKISFQEFRAFETLTRLLPPSAKISEDSEIEKQYTWQQIILAHEAKNKGLLVSDSEVRARIDQLVNPDESTHLAQDQYFQLLKSRHTTPVEFENGVRELIRIQKMLAQRFNPPATTPAVAGAPAQPKKSEADVAEDFKKKQAEYVSWMTEILQRSKAIDYSKKTQRVSPQ